MIQNTKIDLFFRNRFLIGSVGIIRFIKGMEANGLAVMINARK